jgi:hypothetical protein
VKLRSIRTLTGRSRGNPGAGPPGVRSHDISELAVMVRFGALAVAVAAQRVSRIALADEAVRARASSSAVRIGDAVLPAWDLGKMLGFSDAPSAWLIMITGDEPGAPRIALGTGPCIAIAAHGELSSLPAGVVSASPAAVVGVFVTDPALRDRGVGNLGVRVDPMRLIGATELATALRGER